MILFIAIAAAQEIDTDVDGLTDTYERDVSFTDPMDADSDNDGLLDGEEVAVGSDPNDPDSDDDGLTDGEEVRFYGTDPNNPNSDASDGGEVDDGDEIEVGTDPLDGSDDVRLSVGAFSGGCEDGCASGPGWIGAALTRMFSRH